MRKIYLVFALQSIFLIILQVVLLNNVRVMTYLLPILYGYPLFKLPINTSRTILLTCSAIIGLTVDALMNTPGLNMAAFTLVGYIRNPILHAVTPPEVFLDNDEQLRPTPDLIRPKNYFLYMSSCVGIHIITLFFLESFSSQLFTNTLLYIIGAWAMTLFTFLIFDAFTKKKKA